MDSVVQSPESFPLLEDNIRSARIARFPYLIHYRYRESVDKLVVIAVMFGGRDVSAWISRID